jgi:hypothetical protein
MVRANEGWVAVGEGKREKTKLECSNALKGGYEG